MINTRVRAAVASILTGTVLLATTLVGVSSAGAEEPPPENGSIEVLFTPSSGSGIPGWCLPPLLGMSHRTVVSESTFSLIVTVSTRLCSQVDATAVVYAMPDNGEAWPQTLRLTEPVSIREPGVTEILFHRGCSPEQYDVIVGDTPEEIAPWGPWHGPMLFPFDPDSGFQSWRNCGTTTTTESTTTTQPDDTTTTESTTTTQPDDTTTSTTEPDDTTTSTTEPDDTTTTTESTTTTEPDDTTTTLVDPEVEGGDETRDPGDPGGPDQQPPQVAGTSVERNGASNLAFTGSSALAMALAGSLLVGLGGVTLLRTRRRSTV